MQTDATVNGWGGDILPPYLEVAKNKVTSTDHGPLRTKYSLIENRKERYITARPSKSVENLSKHSTKAEIAQRKEAERAALTGIPIRESAETKADAVAHSEFRRVIELLAAVGKNDAMFESVINDYCALKSDINQYKRHKGEIENDISAITESEMDEPTRYKIKAGLYRSMVDFDKQIAAAQKRRFDIEKENGFTVASALRSIPKKAEVKTDLLLEALKGEQFEN